MMRPAGDRDATTSPRLCVIGVGNTLVGDDGIGVEIVQRLRSRFQDDSRVELVDGGVGGIDLVFPLQEVKIGCIIDAADFGGTPGELRMSVADKTTAIASHGLGLHGIGLPEVLVLLRQYGKAPHVYLGLVQVFSAKPGEGLSAPLRDRLPGLVDEVASFIHRLLDGVEPR